MPIDFTTMTPAQIEAERQRLLAADAGYKALQATAGGEAIDLNAQPNLRGAWLSGKIGAADARSAEAKLLQTQRDAKAAENRAAMGELDKELQGRKQKAEQARIESLLSLPSSTPAAPAKTMEQALMEGGNEVPTGPASPGTSPAKPAGEEEMKTIIAARRDPSGKIVFETQRVPVSAAPGGSYSEGVADWKKQALGENAQRAAATAAFQREAPERTSYDQAGRPFQGFQVREGAGGFSPIRALPGLDKSYKEIAATESPLVQDVWMEARQKQLGLGAQEAALTEAQTRNRLAGTQGSILEENLKRLQDPKLGVREQMALREEVSRQLAVEKAPLIEQETQAALDILKRAGTPADDTVAALIRRKIHDKYTGEAAILERIGQVKAGSDAVAASMFRGGTSSYGL